MGFQCVQCKGTKLLCGRPQCPILMQRQYRSGLEEKLNDNQLIGESPSVFVGSYNYPKVFIGPLTGSHLKMDDESSKWYGTPLESIVEHRSQLFRGKEAIKTSEAMDPGKHLQLIQEIAMSEKKVDTDITYKSKPKIEVSFSQVNAPFGPTGETNTLSLESNPKIPRSVDKVVNDELKAVDGMLNLYEKDVTMDEIQRIMSVGLLGIDKKLVPTRWSITASDDTIGKNLLKEIRDFDEMSEYLVFESDYLSNHFQVLLAPGKWSFEELEYYAPGSIWVKENEEPVVMTDWEPYEGRTKYADNTVGGYYASRLGVCEGLMRMKKQGAAVVAREVGSGYIIPLGVWEVRENSRHAMKSKPVKFNNLEEALQFMGSRFKAGRKWEKSSELLNRIKMRTKFMSYFS